MSKYIGKIPALDNPTCLIIPKLERPLFIVGDVHGCLDELELLLDQVVSPTLFDLCFVGDLVDRGPKSLELIEQIIAGDFYSQKVKTYVKPINIYIIMGNHERKIIRNYLNGKEQTGAQSWFNELTFEQKNKFVDLYRYVPSCIYINNQIFIAHAAEPDLLENKIDNYNSFTQWLTTTEIYRYEQPYLVGIRKRDANTCYYGHTTGEKDINGYNIRLHKKPSSVGQFNIFGHQVTKMADMINGNTAYIDQGCVFGGHLTGLLLQQDGPRIVFHTYLQKAKQQYYISEFKDNNEIVND